MKFLRVITNINNVLTTTITRNAVYNAINKVAKSKITRNNVSNSN